MDNKKLALQELEFAEFEKQFAQYIKVATERCKSCDKGDCRTCQNNCNSCPCESCGLYLVRLNTLVADKIAEEKHMEGIIS